MDDAKSNAECMAADTTPPTIPGKGLKEPGIQGAELSADQKREEKEAASAPIPGISNTTPKGQVDASSVTKPKLTPTTPMRKGGAFNPELRPGTSSDRFKKIGSLMQRHGEFNPLKK